MSRVQDRVAVICNKQCMYLKRSESLNGSTQEANESGMEVIQIMHVLV